ncbi:MAG: hypothetical protein Q8N35_05430 [Methylococcaceae bacterium]|nr:hypothetical protein [Methylococcaceae bacterium]MDZ4155899.1 hypothetical protein [Methylococcales bacterium]MDP2392276.1 hypothetical protein [Methylococcaceae bacterium]MDP3019009.1 hypothetical protein [Methylococcaceae bacterium]MDP3391570.1 hypothetical protein [Methylococcaceae bacterium]
MTPDIKQIFIDFTKNQFSFLVDSHSFDGPYTEKDAKTNFLTVYFLRKNLAVEYIFDPREEDIDCKIARVVNGKIANDYFIDSNGILVRQGLAKLLRDRGVRDRLFTNISGLSIEDRIKVTLEDYVNILKVHGYDALNDNASFLDN